ncbi:Protein of unknown function [Nocardioides alpinus]|uniref:DUF2511 domain-containing protein n=1 Tax=Nocardioides alpinus TaxID=748909 RepID=A0A1I1AUP3_9ACTN|nr:DUF2511 domain-containing protein [Nocardioides alpinus]SFB41799.1 Protein of unknown function [Nocardioides alpinus]
MHRLLISLGCVALLSACGSPNEAFSETTTVHRSDVGTAWPLTVDSVPLACDSGVVAVRVADHVTIIDNDTGGRGTSTTFTKIWATDDSRPDGRMDLQPLIEYGQTLCD